MKLLILVPKITNRLRYVFKLLLNELLGLEIAFTTDSTLFLNEKGMKFHYGDQPIGDEIFQKAVSLLFERDIASITLKWKLYNGTKVTFPVASTRSMLPFDVFAATFFLVSRYEEYLPFVPDKFGRFEAESSVLQQEGILQKPVVNHWIIALRNVLSTHFPELQFKKNEFTLLPTYDIDSAWAYRHKGLFRILGGYAKYLLKLNFNEIKFRTAVLRNKEKDPFDTFDLQIALQKEFRLHPIYFILCGDYGPYDKNISIRNRYFCNLIKKLGDYSEVGIHPSFASFLDEKQLQNEINNLSHVLNREVTKSRQHFLRLTIPKTYQKLIELDITDDYTMGYASAPGFRAGIASSFLFYDLEHDVPTNLRIHPFAVMDGTLRDYMNMNVDQAFEIIKTLIDEVKAVDGTFISLWHNETLSDEKRWKGWRNMYRNMIEYALS
ncbi:MAG: polysaccharide deacetylase family protein [Lentimicrobiaceae bacterium]|jgi:hypothetical protein|nr:polysaccharide deacetylase family protein [Lentimicrobiaceae bacterium]